MGGPNVQSEEVTSQATPLAENFLKILQGNLSSEAFGTGVGPLQRESGTALRQFISALQGGRSGPGFVGSGERPGFAGVGETPTVDRGGLDRLIAGLEESSGLRTERSAADLREQGGITGTRFGSSLAQGEGLLRAESGAALDQLIGGLQERGREFDVGLLEGARQFDVGAREGARRFDIGAGQFDVTAREGARQFDIGAGQFDINLLLQSIAQLFGQGQQNVGTIGQFAGLGILPDELIVSPSTTTQIVTGATGLLDAFVPG